MMANHLLPARERYEFYPLSQGKQNNSNRIPTLESKMRAFILLVSNSSSSNNNNNNNTNNNNLFNCKNS